MNVVGIGTMTKKNLKNMDFKFEKYVKFYTKRYEETSIKNLQFLYDEDDDNMPNEQELYDDYIRFISDFLFLQRHH